MYHYMALDSWTTYLGSKRWPRRTASQPAPGSIDKICIRICTCMYNSSCIWPSDRKWMLRCYQRTLTTDDAMAGALNRYERASTHQIGQKWWLPCLEELFWPLRCVCLTMGVWDCVFVCVLDWTGLPALVRWSDWCFWSSFEVWSWSLVYTAMGTQQNFVGRVYYTTLRHQVLQLTMSWVMYILIWPAKNIVKHIRVVAHVPHGVENVSCIWIHDAFSDFISDITTFRCSRLSRRVSGWLSSFHSNVHKTAFDSRGQCTGGQRPS